MSKTISIQPANTPAGEYDVSLPLPYPFHVDPETGDVGRQDFWKGDPARLLGFQRGNIQRVDLTVKAWAADPQQAVGMCPVFLRADGSMFNLTNPIMTVGE